MNDLIEATDQGQATVTQVGKDQNVRRMDVFFLGPLMIREGWKKKSREPLIGWTMIAAGLGTIYYNRKNFLTQEQVKASELSQLGLSDLPRR